MKCVMETRYTKLRINVVTYIYTVAFFWVKSG